MKRKKIMGVLLALSMVACMSACGSSEDTAASDATVTESPEAPAETAEVAEEVVEEVEEKGDYLSTIPYIVINEVNYDVKNDDQYLLEWRTADLTAESGVEDYSALAASLEEYSQALQPSDSDIETYTQMAEDNLTNYGEENVDPEIPLVSMTTDYTPARVDDYLVSIKTLDYVYTGGAHGDSYIGGATFDAKTGKRLAAEDLFTDFDGFLENMKGTFKENITMVVDPEDLNDNYEEAIDIIDLTGDNWYMDSTGFTYVFNEYEIGPYAMGAVEISIGYEQLTPYINADYLPHAEDCIAEVRPGVAGCISLVDGTYISLENDYYEDGHQEGSLQVAGNILVLTDTGYIEDAYIMNRMDKAYLFVNYTTMYTGEDGMSVMRDNFAVLDVTYGDMNVIYDESDVSLDPATLDMDTFYVTGYDGDVETSEMRVVATVLGE